MFDYYEWLDNHDVSKGDMEAYYQREIAAVEWALDELTRYDLDTIPRQLSNVLHFSLKTARERHKTCLQEALNRKEFLSKL